MVKKTTYIISPEHLRGGDWEALTEAHGVRVEVKGPERECAVCRVHLAHGEGVESMGRALCLACWNRPVAGEEE